jgi:hypothetical protein
MYEIDLKAPSGDILVGLTTEAAEAVKVAVLACLVKQLSTPALPVAAPKRKSPRKVEHEAPKRAAIMAALPTVLPTDPGSPLTIGDLVERIADTTSEAVSDSYVANCLKTLMDAGTAKRIKTGQAYSYWRVEGPRPFAPASL